MGATSENFKNEEMACPHCGINGAQQALVDALEAFRAAVGMPVIIDSAYRCPVHNAAVGGAARSEHMLGLAADIRVPGKTAADLESIARTIPAIKGIGRSTPPMTYLHMDVRNTEAAWTYDASGKQQAYYPA